MRFLYGFTGAIFGAALGGATAYLSVSAAVDGDDMGILFLMAIAGPVGLVVGLALGVAVALRVLRFVEKTQDRKRAKSRNALLVGGFVLIVPLLACGMVWRADQYHFPPSDQQLLDNFACHRMAFDKLAQMKLTDNGLMQVHDDFTQPSDSRTVGVSRERIACYRQLLAQAEVRYLQADGPQGTDFLCWAQGGATSSDVAKGYAYLAVPPSRAFKSLDAFRDQSQSEGLPETQAYRSIEGHWYLYYEYVPG